ncbi:adenylyl-sulfate kinase [Halopseudomonas phragmitis]|uniref:Adenylyl-sulfate kinase n=1 Tax=Halopseudomonas phragmitis TaxID=1931241 RepID=A0A1V0B669_9GAMM|nr:adenylyl-sulfate kinase [Halopseudomonas phragmitis]AQZ95284.1 adenylyl-sulfate kinase [Halopseudomonas phragmitis]
MNKNTNITWQASKVNKTERSKQKHQQPCILWFTGLSGAGKTTLANALEQKLFELNHHTYLLDGDNVRHGLNKDLGFSDADRQENIRRIGELAALFVDAGLLVLAAFISPFQTERRLVRELVGPDEFIEIYVATPLSTCEQRDPKGLYKKARAGEIRNFTGIDSEYEAPANPELVVDTSVQTLDRSVEQIVAFLKARGILKEA